MVVRGLLQRGLGRVERLFLHREYDQGVLHTRTRSPE